MNSFTPAFNTRLDISIKYKGVWSSMPEASETLLLPIRDVANIINSCVIGEMDEE